jgi:hypothetical protein
MAVDFPLGWPVGMSEALSDHAAGEGLAVPAGEMFSRQTDRFLRETIGKTALEVGANLIARTAHSANQFLSNLRERSSLPLPLLWSPDERVERGVIEVYPAATKLVSRPRSVTEALGWNSAALSFASGHVEDALWCAVAALHFLRGECHPPPDLTISRREGWIWVRRRDV